MPRDPTAYAAAPGWPLDLLPKKLYTWHAAYEHLLARRPMSQTLKAAKIALLSRGDIIDPDHAVKTVELTKPIAPSSTDNKFFTLRVSPPAHPKTAARRVALMRDV